MYPKKVFFILVYELLERFTYYSIRTILALFFYDVLEFSEHLSTGIFHGLIFIAYVCPLAGAWVADSWLGKYKAILYISFVYIAGTVLLASSSLRYEEYSMQVTTCLSGLLLLSVGSGGVKPCVTPFGADQYRMSEGLSSFFSLFYWFINFGSVVACFFAPYIRSNVKCFGYGSCYFLVFGISAAAITSAVGIFAIGKKWYIIKSVEQNIVNNFFSCLGHSIIMRCRSTEKKQHWLDYADDQYALSFIEDVKAIVAVFVVILPTVVFWALNDKQSSRWVFQARQMDGYVLENFRIEPDQMIAISSLLVLPLVPFFDKVVYPCLGRIGLLKNLFQRMYVGSFLMALTSVMACVLQYLIKHYQGKKTKLHIAWQIPQYIVLVCAEILFIISGSNLIYRQSPPRMRTLVSSLWFLTVSLGNIFAFVVAAIGIPNLEMEFLIDAGLMTAAATIFIFTSSRYRWRDFSEPEVDLVAGESQSNISK